MRPPQSKGGRKPLLEREHRGIKRPDGGYARGGVKRGVGVGGPLDNDALLNFKHGMYLLVAEHGDIRVNFGASHLTGNNMMYDVQTHAIGSQDKTLGKAPVWEPMTNMGRHSQRSAC
jgi:hypothetical protein